DIEAAFGRALFAALGNETGRVRAGVDGDAHHLLGCRHFEIERLCDLRLEACDIVVADVPAILAQMRGDAVGAGFGRNLRRMHGIRVSSAARVADGGDVVYVDAETEVWSRHFLATDRVARGLSTDRRHPHYQLCRGSAAGNVTSSIHPLGVCHHVLRP